MQLKFLCPLFILAIAPPAALAQAQAQSHPAAVTATAPSSAAYQSAFADYKPYKEPVVTSWREANDQVRDTGGMQGHDMANMKSQPDDPHAGHDMSTMRANPGGDALTPVKTAGEDHGTHGAQAAKGVDPHAGHDMSTMTKAKPTPGRKPSGMSATAKKAASDEAAQGAKAPAADPHAGHDMTKMTPAKPAPAPPKTSVAPAAKRAGAVAGAKPVPGADPNAGHDMSKMPAPAPKSAPSGTPNADHAAHGAANQSKNKKESE